MTPEAKEAKRNYIRKWRKANPDKVRAANERYWLKKAQELQNQQEKNK